MSEKIMTQSPENPKNPNELSRGDFLRLFGLGAIGLFLVSCELVNAEEAKSSTEEMRGKEKFEDFVRSTQGRKLTMDLILNNGDPRLTWLSPWIEEFGLSRLVSYKLQPDKGLISLRSLADSSRGSSGGGEIFFYYDKGEVVKILGGEADLDVAKTAVARMNKAFNLIGVTDKKATVVFEGSKFGIKMPFIEGPSLHARITSLVGANKTGEAEDLAVRVWNEVILPLNREGFVLPDTNLRNFIVDSGGKIVPIDTNKVQNMGFEIIGDDGNRSVIEWWQYERYRLSCAKRGVMLPDFITMAEKSGFSIDEETMGFLNNLGSVDRLMQLNLRVSGDHFAFIMDGSEWNSLSREEKISVLESMSKKLSSLLRIRSLEPGDVLKLPFNDDEVLIMTSFNRESDLLSFVEEAGKIGWETLNVAGLLLLFSNLLRRASYGYGATFDSLVPLVDQQLKLNKASFKADPLNIFNSGLIAKERFGKSSLKELLESNDFWLFLGLTNDESRIAKDWINGLIVANKDKRMQLSLLSWLETLTFFVPGPLIPVKVEFGSGFPLMPGPMENVDGLLATSFIVGNEQIVWFVERESNEKGDEGLRSVLILGRKPNEDQWSVLSEGDLQKTKFDLVNGEFNCKSLTVGEDGVTLELTCDR